MIALALLLSLPFAFEFPAADADVRENLVLLTSAESVERERAERWLTAHVGPEDFELLKTAAAEGDPEVRRRLARALGAADRHLGLTVRLFAAGEAERRVAEEAIRLALARWNPDLFAPPLFGEDLRRALGFLVERRRPEVLQVDLTAPLAESLDYIARRPGVNLALVVSPGLATRASFPPGSEPVCVAGDWARLVRTLAGDHGVGLEGFGIPAERGGERGPGGGFLHVTSRDAVGRGSAPDLVLDWCRLLGERKAGSLRADAARALAATGWPAALGLLEQLHGADPGDQGALDGLLLAASQGRIARQLLAPATLTRLVDRAAAGFDRGDEAGVDWAHRLLRALDGAGGLRPGGEDLSGPILAGWDRASPRGRWLRLALLEGLGAGGAGRAGDPLARTREVLVAAPEAVAPELRRQALRTWVVLAWGQDEVPVLGDPTGLLGTPRTDREARELTALLARGRFAPPAAWRSPADLPVSLGERGRGILLAWWLQANPAVAGDHLLALLGGAGSAERAAGERAARVLESCRLRGEAQEAAVALERARSLASAPGERIALDRVALLAGMVTPAELGPVLERIGGTTAPAGGQPDWVLLGAVGAFPVSGGAPTLARRTLLDRLGQVCAEDVPLAEAAPVLEALERVLAGVFAAGDMQSGLGDGILAEIDAPLRKHRRSRLAQELLRRGWPLPPRVDPPRPGEEDRRLDPARLPLR